MLWMLWMLDAGCWMLDAGFLAGCYVRVSQILFLPFVCKKRQ
jgi:hypothetical protein